MADQIVKGDRLRWPAQAALLCSGVFGSLALSALSPVLPNIQAEFAGVPNVDFWTKAVVTIDGIAMLAAPFAGIAAYKFGGPRRLMIASYVMFLIFGLGGAFVPNLFGIIATRFFVGIAGAFLLTMSVSLIGDCFEGQARELRIGLLHAMSSLLIGAMVSLSGFLGDTYGWRSAFGVHLLALPFLLCVLASPELSQFRTIPRSPPKERSPLLPVLPIAALAFIAGTIALGVPIFVPFHLQDLGNDKAVMAGFMFAIVAGSGVCGGLAFGFLRRLLSSSQMLLLAFSLWVIGLLICGLSTTMPMIALSMVVIGFGGGTVQPSIFSLIAKISSPAELARNNGLAKACFYSSPFVGTSVLHFLLDGFDANASLLALGGLAALLLLAAVPVARGADRRSATMADVPAVAGGGPV